MNSLVNKNRLPRVLIFGQPFNRIHGGGITLSNLFEGWDKNKIAVAATGHVMYNITTDVCDNYYQLGFKEFKWVFPFNLVQRKFTSGRLHLTSEHEKEWKNGKIKWKSRLRSKLVDDFFYPALEWFGLFHAISEIRMSDEFKTWLSEFNPEILYLQVSTRETILFAHRLSDYLKIPGVIHMMDDWPSTISKYGPFKKYWKKRIDEDFRNLLGHMNLFLSISDAMSFEYFNRYGKKYKAFHNPIDIEFWQKCRKINYKISDDKIKILYSGRIGPGIADSILEVADAIESLNQTDYQIKFHIQSASIDNDFLTRLCRRKCIIINDIVAYSELPGIYSGADILVIANDFDDDSIKFLRYSMPTKASEYMISGTPVIVYSHADTAVSRFFSENDCGLCVKEKNQKKLTDALRQLIENEDLRERLGSKAIRLAEELFDSEKVREEFSQLLIKTSAKKHEENIVE